MAASIVERLGFRKASGVDQAGWGRTLVVAIVATVMGLFLGGVDLVFGWVIEQLFF